MGEHEHDCPCPSCVEDRVRITAEDVVKAADAWERSRAGSTTDAAWYAACDALGIAVEAHRKALAEQAKEASRG